MLFRNRKQKVQIMAKTTTTDPKTAAAATTRKTPAKNPATRGTTAAKPAAKPAGKAGAKTSDSKTAATKGANPQRAAGTTSRKAATAPDAAAAIAAAPHVEPVVVTETRGGGSGTEMKKRDLVDRVAAHGKLKKSQVKPVVDAMLAVLAQALTDGQELNLPPLGKMKVNRQKTTSGGQIILIKLRTGTGTGTGASKSAAGSETAANSGAEIAAETDDEVLAEPAE